MQVAVPADLRITGQLQVRCAVMRTVAADANRKVSNRIAARASAMLWPSSGSSGASELITTKVSALNPVGVERFCGGCLFGGSGPNCGDQHRFGPFVGDPRTRSAAGWPGLCPRAAGPAVGARWPM